MKLIALIALPLLVACHGKVLDVSKTPGVRHQVTESCSKSGWCHRCTGSGDNRSCGYGWSAFCPGVRNIIQESWTETRRYQDGYVSTSSERRKVENLTGCQ